MGLEASGLRRGGECTGTPVAIRRASARVRRSLDRGVMTIKTNPVAGRQSSATPDSVDRAMSLWLSERLHALWRKAVRTPWRNARRAMRRAMTAKSNGIPVAVDHTTRLAVVPFAGRFPPPLAQCVVVEPCQYRTRLHPLSVNSTTAERVHYLDHTVEAPAMTLEHLVDQYWFPALGLLLSPEGQVWRHSFLGPFQDGFLASIKAIVDRAAPDGTREHLLYPERLRRIPTLSGEHLLIANSDQPNFGHYMLDIVPLVHLGARMGVPMLTWTMKPWQREALARLDVPPGLIREIKPKAVFLEHAIASNRLSGMSSQNAHPQHRQAFSLILENVKKHAATTQCLSRILICRGLKNSRNIKNRKSLIEALSPLGFAAIQPEKLKFDEQAMLFSGADVIVTEFGAAMANVMFCRPGTRVVEIIAEGQHDPWSAHLCAMLELDHVVLFQRQSEQDLLDHPRHAKDSEFQFSVDIEGLVQRVETLIGNH
jgi:capsular polysaccharide biosynthesis protein